MSTQPVVAAFDFDGTLTRRDSVVPFLLRFSGARRLVGGLLRHAHRVLPMVARRSRDDLRTLATRLVLTGVPANRIDATAISHADALVERGLRDDTRARLDWHLEQGHRVVIVSASYESYVRVVADRLGGGRIDVLATRLELVDGVCTGRLDGANCRGPEKVRRLTGWMEANGLDRGDVIVHAYGDSAGDVEMLAWADHPHRVSRRLDSVGPSS